MKMPDFSFEQKIISQKVAGVDEAGCGPWAGPVVAAAVMFFEYNQGLWAGLNDSKKLTTKKREQCFEMLTNSTSLVYGIGSASVEEIDNLNIGNATRLSVERAIAALPIQPEHVLIDGIRKPTINIPFTMIVKGDSLSLSISAASIIAKVTRDRIMTELSKKYPVYCWSKNAGYGTSIHQDALRNYGVTPHHRKSFAPIRALLGEAA
ncbi:MAG: ribonuclease HII [Alphaproteobacteria bacterium]